MFSLYESFPREYLVQIIFKAAFNACHWVVSAAQQAGAMLYLLLPLAVLATATVARAESTFQSAGVTYNTDTGDIDARPVVYLTFDDGPSADMVTDAVLQILAKHGATATFFVTGQRVRREPEKISEIVYAGHAIGNHTLNHSKLTQISDAEVVRELQTASEVILQAGGPPATCFRPPFGSTDSRVNRLAGELGLVPVGWSIDTRDWERSTSTTEIADALARTSDNSIVLMHDGPTYRGKTLLALSSWMETQAHRFQFRALPECSSGGEVLQLADVKPAESSPVIAKYQEPRKHEPVEQEAIAPVVETPKTIPQLLRKIRSYRFVLHEDGQRVDLTQVTAKLNSEIREETRVYSF